MCPLAFFSPAIADPAPSDTVCARHHPEIFGRCERQSRGGVVFMQRPIVYIIAEFARIWDLYCCEMVRSRRVQAPTPPASAKLQLLYVALVETIDYRCRAAFLPCDFYRRAVGSHVRFSMNYPDSPALFGALVTAAECGQGRLNDPPAISCFRNVVSCRHSCACPPLLPAACCMWRRA